MLQITIIVFEHVANVRPYASCLIVTIWKWIFSLDFLEEGQSIQCCCLRKGGVCKMVPRPACRSSQSCDWKNPTQGSPMNSEFSLTETFVNNFTRNFGIVYITLAHFCLAHMLHMYNIAPFYVFNFFFVAYLFVYMAVLMFILLLLLGDPCEVQQPICGHCLSPRCTTGRIVCIVLCAVCRTFLLQKESFMVWSSYLARGIAFQVSSFQIAQIINSDTSGSFVHSKVTRPFPA